MQKTFKGCKFIRLLRFDFYLPDYNMCIEYDGAQHYGIKINIYDMDFDIIKKRDNIKNNFCQTNKIKLLRVPYWKFKNIDKILKEEIFYGL